MTPVQLAKKCWRLALLLALGGCATATVPGPGGTLSGKLVVQWVAENRFIYRPDAADPLRFRRPNGQQVVPQEIFTDGGSIPPVFWSLPGFSPWGYGPAYIVHDWLFQQHRCRLPGWETVTFEDSAVVLGEVIDTLMRRGDVPLNVHARSLIEEGVRTSIARGMWDSEGDCRQPITARSGGRSAPSGPIIIRLDLSAPRRP